MSVAQIVEESKTFSLPELESLQHSLRLERLRRTLSTVPDEERRLLRIINQPMAEAERFTTLTEKWGSAGLSDEERAELLRIVTAREGCNAERVEAVGRLSELRGVAFKALWEQLMGEAPTPLVPRD